MPSTVRMVSSITVLPARYMSWASSARNSSGPVVGAGRPGRSAGAHPDRVLVGGHMLIGGAEPQPNRVLLGSVRRDLPHHLADGGDAVVGDAAGDAVAGHHGAAGVDHLPLHRERLTRPVIVVHHVHCLAQSGAGGFALQVGPLHHHVQRTERLPERIPGLLLLAVVVHHRRGDRRPAVLEVEEQAAVAGIELVPAVEVDVVLVQKRLVVLAVDTSLRIFRLGAVLGPGEVVRRHAGEQRHLLDLAVRVYQRHLAVHPRLPAACPPRRRTAWP